MANEIVDKEQGVELFLKEKSLDKLHLLFDIFSRDDSKYDVVLAKLKSYIEEQGALIVQNEANVKDPLQFT